MERAKVAVAIALLRSKPIGISGEEYTRQLAEKYISTDLNWKHQYEQAESEILHLKQKLHILNTTRDVNHGGIEMPELLAESSQKLFPTPPSSGSMNQPKRIKHTEDVQSTLTQNTEFLHHVMNLITFSHKASVDKNLQAVAQESVFNSLRVLQNHFGKNTISWALQKGCVEGIVNLTEVAETSLQIDLKDKVTDLCGNIIHTLMSLKDNTYKSQENCVETLFMLGKCKSIEQVLVDKLIVAIKKHSGDLKQCTQQKTSLDANRFCNSYYLLKACELCLTRDRIDRMTASDKTLTCERLQDSLLHISDSFPLYAHLIWRICASLT
ncbi:Meiosis-specific protein mei4 [Mactra antiquata]